MYIIAHGMMQLLKCSRFVPLQGVARHTKVRGSCGVTFVVTPFKPQLSVGSASKQGISLHAYCGAPLLRVAQSTLD
jgi:hypothetical protein